MFLQRTVLSYFFGLLLSRSDLDTKLDIRVFNKPSGIGTIVPYPILLVGRPERGI